MFRKGLCILAAVSVTALSWADEFNQNFSQSPYCKEESQVFPFKNSQESFVSKFVCDNMESGSDVTFDRNYCENVVRQCQLSKDSKSNLPDSDLNMLWLESYDLLVRANAAYEMEKFKNNKAYNMRSMLAYINRLPESDRKNLKQCGQSVPENMNCLDRPEMDQMANSYIGSMYCEKAVETIDGSHDASQAMDAVGILLATKIAEVPGDQVLKIIRANEVKNNAYLNESESQNIDAINAIVLRKLTIEMQRASTDLALTSDQVKSNVKAILKNISKNTDDPILNYDRDGIINLLDKHLESSGFVASDFDSQNKSAQENLLKKINKLRVQIANDYIARDCGSINLTIGQVCSNMAKNFQDENILKKLSINNVLLGHLANYHMYSSDKKRQAKASELGRMQNDGNPNYQKYLEFIVQVNACDLKFPKEKTAVQTKQIQNLADETEKASKKIREESIENVRDYVRYDANIQKEFKQLGVTLDNDTVKVSERLAGNKDTIASSSSVAKTDVDVISPARELKSVTDLKSPPKGFLEGEIPPAVRSNKLFDSNINMPVNNQYQNIRAIPADEDDSKLRSKLVELESKEKLISKKLSEASSEQDIQSSSDELQSLKKEIDELKAMKERPLTGKDKPVAKKYEGLSSGHGAPNEDRENFGTHAKSQAKAQAPAQVQLPAQSQASITQAPSNPSGANAASRSAGAISSQSTTDRAKVSSGIILTKMGEAVIDASSVLDNPKDGDIMTVIEDTNGQPILIRENGALVKISVELDSAGNPQMGKNGKPLLKKSRLTKAQEDKVLKEASNDQKSLKEVVDRTRLYELKSLLKQAVQRN